MHQLVSQQRARPILGNDLTQKNQLPEGQANVAAGKCTNLDDSHPHGQLAGDVPIRAELNVIQSAADHRSNRTVEISSEGGRTRLAVVARS